MRARALLPSRLKQLRQDEGAPRVLGGRVRPGKRRGNPAGLEELRAAGVPRVPAVVWAAASCTAGIPPRYAALVGVDYRPPVQFSPRGAGGAAGPYPRPPRGGSFVAAPRRPGPQAGEARPRPAQSRLPRIPPAARLRGRDGHGGVPGRPGCRRRRRPTSPTARRSRATAPWCAAASSGWFEGAGEASTRASSAVYYGPQSGHDLLERTTWHAAQHLRQLHVVATRAGRGLARSAARGRLHRPPDAGQPLVR